MRQSTILWALLLAGCSTPERGLPDGRARALYSNPVLDTDFPDPSLLKAADGRWHAYGTQG